MTAAERQQVLGALERLQAKLVQKEEWSHSAAVGSLRGALQSPLFNHILTLQHSIKQLRSQVGRARRQRKGLSQGASSSSPTSRYSAYSHLSSPSTPPLSSLLLLCVYFSFLLLFFLRLFSNSFLLLSSSFLSLISLSFSSSFIHIRLPISYCTSSTSPFSVNLFSPVCCSTINSQIKIMAVTSSGRRPASYSKCCQGQQLVYEDLAPPTVCRLRHQQHRHLEFQ